MTGHRKIKMGVFPPPGPSRERVVDATGGGAADDGSKRAHDRFRAAGIENLRHPDLRETVALTRRGEALQIDAIHARRCIHRGHRINRRQLRADIVEQVIIDGLRHNEVVGKR